MTASRAQDLTVTVTVAGADASAWAMTATLRAFAGGTALATKTTSGGGIVATYDGSADTSVVVTFTDTDLTLAPGLYVWELVRTTADAAYAVVDPSGFLITTNAAGSYPTLTNVSVLEAYTGLTVSDSDLPFYLLSLAAAERAIRKLCGRDPADGFLYKSRTEYPLCRWGRYLTLQETPVSTITTVHESRDQTWDSTTLLDSDDYRLDLDGTDGKAHAGRLLRVNGYWAGDRERPLDRLASRRTPARNVQVVYYGGYATPPEELVIATVETVQQAKMARLRGTALQSESGESYSYSMGDYEKEAGRLLSVQHIVSTYGRASSFVA